MALYEDYLYARISDDELATEKGVTRQLRDGRDLSARRGGHVAGEFSDNDISALKGAPRPDFDKLMNAVAAPNPTGVQRRIVCVHTSRLWRNRVERAQGIDTLGKLGIIILCTNGPELDLRTASGRMIAGMLGETDTGESETKAERVYDAAKERAEEGRANGAVLYGWSRIYEYDRRGKTAGKVIGFRDEEKHAEADVVRWIVDELLAGKSLAAVRDDLNRRRVPAPGAGHRRTRRAKGQADDGSRWGKTSVKKLAIRPANIGLRIYHRGRPDEALIPAAWPKIVDPDKHDRVVALLTDPGRTIERPGSRQHLLTWGVGECGVCGAHLRVAMRGNSRHGRKQQLYVCEAKACVGRNLAAVDRYVEHQMVALMRRPDVADLLSGSSAKAAEALTRVTTLRARLTQAANDYADGHIEAAQLRIITTRLKPQLQQAEAEAKAYRPSPHLELVMATVGDLAERRWGALDLNQRRAVMQAFGVRVVVLPAQRRGPGFDPASVRFVPRSADVAVAAPVPN
ncbi:recombinase family protein [Plantactinospora sp. WMMB782]|uniref:recombinase family protein n=2 Tax=Plantactinospora sp. WMMB782 TaxID=3404121 RepID=UPI003B948324